MRENACLVEVSPNENPKVVRMRLLPTGNANELDYVTRARIH